MSFASTADPVYTSLPDNVTSGFAQIKRIARESYSHTVLTERICLPDPVDEYSDASMYACLLSSLDKIMGVIATENEEYPALKYQGGGIAPIVGLVAAIADVVIPEIPSHVRHDLACHRAMVG